MKYQTTAKALGNAFHNAHQSLWKNGEFNHTLSVKKQVQGWKDKFHVKITGGHFDNVFSTGENEWNTEDVVLEFESEAACMLFMLEWS
jgi:hypothetical protein